MKLIHFMIFFLLANSIIGFVRFQWQKWLRKLELREHLAAAFHGKHLNLSFSRGFCYFSDFFYFWNRIDALSVFSHFCQNIIHAFYGFYGILWHFMAFCFFFVGK